MRALSLLLCGVGASALAVGGRHDSSSVKEEHVDIPASPQLADTRVASEGNDQELETKNTDGLTNDNNIPNKLPKVETSITRGPDMLVDLAGGLKRLGYQPSMVDFLVSRLCPTLPADHLRWALFGDRFDAGSFFDSFGSKVLENAKFPIQQTPDPNAPEGPEIGTYRITYLEKLSDECPCVGHFVEGIIRGVESDPMGKSSHHLSVRSKKKDKSKSETKDADVSDSDMDDRLQRQAITEEELAKLEKQAGELMKQLDKLEETAKLMLSPRDMSNMHRAALNTELILRGRICPCIPTQGQMSEEDVEETPAPALEDRGDKRESKEADDEEELTLEESLDEPVSDDGRDERQFGLLEARGKIHITTTKITTIPKNSTLPKNATIAMITDANSEEIAASRKEFLERARTWADKLIAEWREMAKPYADTLIDAHDRVLKEKAQQQQERQGQEGQNQELSVQRREDSQDDPNWKEQWQAMQNEKLEEDKREAEYAEYRKLHPSIKDKKKQQQQQQQQQQQEQSPQQQYPQEYPQEPYPAQLDQGSQGPYSKRLLAKATRQMADSELQEVVEAMGKAIRSGDGNAMQNLVMGGAPGSEKRKEMDRYIATYTAKTGKEDPRARVAEMVAALSGGMKVDRRLKDKVMEALPKTAEEARKLLHMKRDDDDDCGCGCGAPMEKRHDDDEDCDCGCGRRAPVAARSAANKDKEKEVEHLPCDCEYCNAPPYKPIWDRLFFPDDPEEEEGKKDVEGEIETDSGKKGKDEDGKLTARRGEGRRKIRAANPGPQVMEDDEYYYDEEDMPPQSPDSYNSFYSDETEDAPQEKSWWTKILDWIFGPADGGASTANPDEPAAPADDDGYEEDYYVEEQEYDNQEYDDDGRKKLRRGGGESFDDPFFGDVNELMAHHEEVAKSWFDKFFSGFGGGKKDEEADEVEDFEKRGN